VGLILRRYWGVFLILALAVIGISERPYHNQELLNSASGETMTSQIGRDVQDTLDTLKTSMSFRDWRASGFLPGDVLKNAFALRRTEAREAICTTLKSLPPKDLSVFEPALNTQDAGTKLLCTGDLLDEIENYWIEQTTDADNMRAGVANAAIPLVVKKVSANSVHEINTDLLENGEFALVFEGGLDPVQTREILKTLKDHSAKATFLVPGQSARDHSDLLEQITKMGDRLGAQTLNSMDLTTIPMNEADKQISDGVHAVAIAGEVESLLFSFPFASSNETLDQMVTAKGLKIVRSDLDSEDWKHYDPAELVTTVNTRTKASSKGILLFRGLLHQTAIALPAILDNLAASHRKLVIFDVK
jgi:peptidoglycan/xylan/chitin deacetylase (PgdA/CDA1 family)